MLRWRNVIFRRRSRKRRTTRIKAKPARPPTTLPTKTGVDGELPLPEPAAALVDEEGAPPAVSVGPPVPPSTPLP